MTEEGQDEWVEDDTRLREMVLEFYKQQYTTKLDQTDELVINDFPRLSHANKQLLNRPVSLLKVKAVVFQMGAHKALGSNGLIPILFQKYWDIMQETVWRFVQEAFRVGHLSE